MNGESRFLRRPEPDCSMPFGLRAGLNPLRRRPLAYLALFWAIGAMAGYYGRVPWMLFILPAFVFFAASIWSRRLACLCAAFLFCAASISGALRIQPERMEKQTVEITALACSDIDVQEEYAVLTVGRVTLNGADYGHKIRLYIYPNGEQIPQIYYGDRISATASVITPKGKTGFGAYDRAAALWRDGIALTGNVSAKNITCTQGEWSPMAAIMRARRAFGRRLDVLYPANSALARALLLGDRTQLTDDEYEAFQDAGIVHLLAVSGLHISVLAEAVRLFLKKALHVPRRAAYWIVLPFLVLYAAITGFPSSILRAAICFALTEAAPLTGRPADRITSLAAAFLLLSWLDPISAFDAGFQLSFCAMLGLCLLAPVLQSALTPARGSESRALKLLWSPVQAAIDSGAVLLSTLPVCVNLFGGLTVWSVAANIVAIPVTSALMPVLMLSLFFDGAALPAGWLMQILHWMAVWIENLPARLYISMPQMKSAFVAAYACAGYLCCVPVAAKKERRRALGAGRLVLVALLFAIAALSTQLMERSVLGEDGLSLTFIDVGQGDSALVNAQGLCYMVDTGEGSAAQNRLQGKNVALEALFLTHPDDDHAGAAAEVIEAGGVQRVYLPECWQRMAVPERIDAALRGCDVVYLAAGDTLSLSQDVSAVVLHPPRGYIPQEDNAASLVLWLRYGEGSALLMGDLADDDIDFDIPDCDVIKLAHHGSETSSGARLLASASPSAAVVSVGTNRYGHPAEEVLERLAEREICCLRTDESGDIFVQILPGGGLTTRLGMEGMEE